MLSRLLLSVLKVYIFILIVTIINFPILKAQGFSFHMLIITVRVEHFFLVWLMLLLGKLQQEIDEIF